MINFLYKKNTKKLYTTVGKWCFGTKEDRRFFELFYTNWSQIFTQIFCLIFNFDKNIWKLKKVGGLDVGGHNNVEEGKWYVRHWEMQMYIFQSLRIYLWLMWFGIISMNNRHMQKLSSEITVGGSWNCYGEEEGIYKWNNYKKNVMV